MSRTKMSNPQDAVVLQEQIAGDLTELIGHTPLLRLNRIVGDAGAEVVAKLESWNPGGSVKDRIGLSMIEAAEKAGVLKPGGVIIEATSGNTGIGLAWVAAVKGYRLMLAMPESMSMERRKLLTALGAELILTDAEDGMEGSIEKSEVMAKHIEGSFIPHQFANPANPAIHEATTGPEIWQAAGGKVDIFVAGVGTGGTVTGVGRYLRTQNPNVQIVAVEPSESAVLAGKHAGPHMIQGIGASFIPDNMDVAVPHLVEQVDSQEAIKTAKQLALQEGVLVGISSGAAATAAIRLARLPENKGKRIVALFPDTGERYISTLLFYED